MYVCRPWESLNTPSTSISAEVTIPGYCMTWAALWVLATVILFPFVDVSYRLLVERPGKKLGLGDDSMRNCLTSSHSGMPGCLTSRTVNITGRFSTNTSLFVSHSYPSPLSRLFEAQGPRSGADLNPYHDPLHVHVSQAIFILTDAYLRSATAIIFLAPISAFDQVSHMVNCRASIHVKPSGRLANRINATLPYSTLKRIRGRIA